MNKFWFFNDIFGIHADYFYYSTKHGKEFPHHNELFQSFNFNKNIYGTKVNSKKMEEIIIEGC